MGDLISKSWGPGAWRLGDDVAEGDAGVGAAPECETITCPSPEPPTPTVFPFPAFDTRTDDHAPNRPRRISIAPTSGPSFRICTICAMMSIFMNLQQTGRCSDRQLGLHNPESPIPHTSSTRSVQPSVSSTGPSGDRCT